MKNTLARSLAVATLAGVGIAVAVASTALRTKPAPVVALPGEPPATGFDAADKLLFTPQYPLWTDGASKRRWIRLPAGAVIDAREVDVWEFPVGTQLWKEFAFGGKPVETRYMVRTAAGWHYATYVWNADATEATLAPRAGAASVEIAPGVRHRIPSEGDCRACHAGAPTSVLGFSALQLSPDRDPNAPHAEVPGPGSIDLLELVARDLVRGLPAAMLSAPPRIPGPPVERAALGYLHANCGGCHRSDGVLATVGMDLTASVAAPGAAKRTTIAQPSSHLSPHMRIAPGDPQHSVVVERMSSRDPRHQMPPLGSQLVDAEANELLSTWITNLRGE